VLYRGKMLEIIALEFHAKPTKGRVERRQATSKRARKELDKQTGRERGGIGGERLGAGK